MARRVEAGERGLELDRDGDFDRDVVADRGGDGAGGEVVERIGHGEGKNSGFQGDRQGAGGAEEAGFEALGEERLGRVAGGDGERDAEQGRVGGGEVALGDQAELLEDEIEAALGLGGDAAGALDRPLVAEAAGEDQRRQRADPVAAALEYHRLGHTRRSALPVTFVSLYDKRSSPDAR